MIKGTHYISMFRWLYLFLVTLVIGAGMNSVVTAAAPQRTEVVSATWVDIPWSKIHINEVILLILTLLSLLLYLTRYLMWTPWTLLVRVREAAAASEDHDLSPNVIREGLESATSRDLIWSIMYLSLEFPLIYLIAASLGSGGVLLFMLLVLPILDLIPPLVVYFVAALNGARLAMKMLFAIVSEAVREVRNRTRSSGEAAPTGAGADTSALEEQWASNVRFARSYGDLGFWSLNAMDFVFPLIFLAMFASFFELWGPIATASRDGGLAGMLDVLSDGSSGKRGQTCVLLSIMFGGVLAFGIGFWRKKSEFEDLAKMLLYELDTSHPPAANGAGPEGTS